MSSSFRPLLPAESRGDVNVAAALPEKLIRRPNVTVACLPCQKAKTKCSGERPVCHRCSTRASPCEYDVRPNETRVSSLRHTDQRFRELYTYLRTRPWSEALEILKRIRGNLDPLAVVQLIRDGDILLHNPSLKDRANDPSSQGDTNDHNPSDMLPDCSIASPWTTIASRERVRDFVNIFIEKEQPFLMSFIDKNMFLADMQAKPERSRDGRFCSALLINAICSIIACRSRIAAHSRLAWTGLQFTNAASFTYYLYKHEVTEVEHALTDFLELGVDGDQICRSNFVLPTLGPKLNQIRQDIHNGKGFTVIRGLEPSKYSAEVLSMLYLGIQSHLANKLGRQDSKGNMLVHIIADDSSELAAAHHRHSNKEISFHNEEAGDLVSWLTRSTAAKGGRCIIASGYTVYNVLAATRPDIVRTLAGSDWPFSMPHFHCRPIVFHHKGRLVINFGRAPLMGSASHPRAAQLPTLSPGQLEALDAIEAIARATQLEIVTQPGDIHVINNLAILHRRECFVDGTMKHERRHLVRTILRDEQLGWSIPGDLEDEWFKAFDPTEIKRLWHIDPMPAGYFPLRSQPN